MWKRFEAPTDLEGRSRNDAAFANTTPQSCYCAAVETIASPIRKTLILVAFLVFLVFAAISLYPVICPAQYWLVTCKGAFESARMDDEEQVNTFRNNKECTVVPVRDWIWSEW
jgi:hypothetical protein